MAPKHAAALFLAVAAVFLAGTTAVHSSSNLAALCSRSKYPVICNRVIDGKTTAASAAAATIETLLRKTAEAKSFTQNTAGAHVDKFSKQLINSCIELYDTTVSDLQNSLTSLKSGDSYSLINSLSATMSNINACNDGFLEDGASPLGGGSGHPNPLNKINLRLTKLTSTALALSHEIN